MMTHRQSWQIPVLIILSIPLWQGFAGRFLTIEQGAVAPPVRQETNFTLEGVTFSQTTHGVRDVTLKAKHLFTSNENGIITMDEIDANRLGNNPVHIISGSAVYDPDKEIITLLDDVLVEAANLVIKTPFMRYLVKHETIKSAGEVSITGDEITLRGTSFMYNLITSDMRIGKRVHFTYTPVLP